MRSSTLFIFLTLVVCGVLGTLGLMAAEPNPQTRNVTPVPSGSPSDDRGDYYALVIGIANYEHFMPLGTTLDDANDVGSILQDKYGFHVQFLRDATRDQIVTALSSYRRTLSEKDNLLIYYAGHGYYDTAEDLAYWFPAEAEKNSPAHWINATEITSLARAVPARHVLIISDSCYSGMIARGDTPTVGVPQNHDVYIERLLHGKSRYVISSGGDEPVADTDPGSPSKHSVFANALLRGLRDFDSPAFSAEELFYQYIRQQVIGRSQQKPEYDVIRNSGHDSGGFVFFRAIPAPGVVARTASGPPDLAVLNKAPQEPASAGLGNTATETKQQKDMKQQLYAGLQQTVNAFLRSNLSEWKPGGPIDAVDLQPLRALRQPTPDERAYGIAFSPDGKLLASAGQEVAMAAHGFRGNGSIHLWDVDTGALLRTLQTEGASRPGDRFSYVAFSPDGQLVAASTDAGGGPNFVQVWDVATGKLLHVLQATDSIRRIAFSPDGKMIAGACDDSAVHVWDAVSGTLLRTLKHDYIVVSVAFKPDDPNILAAGDYKQSVRVWDLRTGNLIRVLHSTPPSYGEAVAFSPDGNTLATGHTSGNVLLWSSHSWIAVRTVLPRDPNNGINSVAFSPDGRLLAATSTQQTLRFWDRAQGKLLGTFDIGDRSGFYGAGTMVVFHPLRRLVATVSGDSIQIWQLVITPH